MENYREQGFVYHSIKTKELSNICTVTSNRSVRLVTFLIQNPVLWSSLYTASITACITDLLLKSNLHSERLTTLPVVLTTLFARRQTILCTRQAKSNACCFSPEQNRRKQIFKPLSCRFFPIRLMLTRTQGVILQDLMLGNGREPSLAPSPHAQG